MLLQSCCRTQSAAWNKTTCMPMKCRGSKLGMHACSRYLKANLCYLTDVCMQDIHPHIAVLIKAIRAIMLRRVNVQLSMPVIIGRQIFSSLSLWQLPVHTCHLALTPQLSHQLQVQIDEPVPFFCSGEVLHITQAQMAVCCYCIICKWLPRVYCVNRLCTHNGSLN